ncbi:MAG: DUF1570 domain-containing protein [Lysobacteraceae bacterium]|nr:MAG: DUF1570 domain-containing protein [Xanthomonadaceae bacterium]
MILHRLLLPALLACASGCGRQEPAVVPPAIPAGVVATRHYRIHSEATPAQTDAVAGALEKLHASYAQVFPVPAASTPLTVVLYRDRATFKRNNRSAPWAEAYYRRPLAFAYPGDAPNPHHWALHEAAHQLLAEAGGFTLPRWLGEGLASCFGAGTLDAGGLHTERPDPDAYPVWWLRDVRAAPDGQPTFAGQPLLRLQDLVEGTGPPVGAHVNHYYVAWWSLAHYLLHGDGGSHRQALVQLVRAGGDAADFRRLVGDYAQVEPRWHAHLLALAASAAAPEAP